jgi:hypothetical protein
MLNSTILDVVFGLVSVFLALSLFTSALTEAVSTVQPSERSLQTINKADLVRARAARGRFIQRRPDTLGRYALGAPGRSCILKTLSA